MTHQRREPRHKFRIPVGVAGRHQGELPGTCCDLSRGGIRVRVRIAELKLGPVRFAEILEGVRERFGRGMTIRFHAAGIQGARSVSKDAAIMRLATASEDGLSIEMGCLFASPLTLDEISALGAPPSLERGAKETTQREVLDWETLQALTEEENIETVGGRPACGNRIARPSQRHPAQVRSAIDRGESLAGITELVTPDALMIRFPALCPTGDSTIDVVAVQFAQTYGERVRVTLGELLDPVYTGWGRVGAFELAHDDAADVLVTVSLERPLDQSARGQLGFEVGAGA